MCNECRVFPECGHRIRPTFNILGHVINFVLLFNTGYELNLVVYI